MKQSTSLFQKTSIEPVQGTGGGVSIGSPIIGGNANEFLYVDNSGNLAQDNKATRNSLAGFTTLINSYSLSFGWESGGFASFQAVEYGPIGDSISLVFNGIDDCATVIAAWNLANPTNTVSLISGSPTYIPAAQTVNLYGGGKLYYLGGQEYILGLPAYGAGIGFQDSYGSVSLSRVGSIPFLGSAANFGYYNFTNGFGNLSANFAFVNPLGDAENQLVVTDMMSFSSGVGVTKNDARLYFNNTSIGVDQFGFVTWVSGGITYYLPNTFSGPSPGDVLNVTMTGPGSVFLDFITPTGGGIPNGTVDFQFWRWNNFTLTQGWDQLWAATGNSNVAIGVVAGGLSESANPYGFSSNNVFIGDLAGKSLNPALSSPSQTAGNVIIGVNAATVLNEAYDSVLIGHEVYNGGTGPIGQSVIISPTTLGGTSPVQTGVAIGYLANVEGSSNTAIGFQALRVSATTASYNTAVGAISGDFAGANTSYNTFLGAYAGNGFNFGTRNLFLGVNTLTLGGASSDSIALGAYAAISNNNQLVIGGNDLALSQEGAIYEIRLNNGITDYSAQKYTLLMPSVNAGNVDYQGGTFVIDCGAGTGMGRPSQFTLIVSDPYSVSGATPQNRYEAMTFYGARYIEIGDYQNNFNNTYITIDDNAQDVTIKANDRLALVSGFYAGDNLHNNTTAYGNASSQEVRSGTYLPNVYAVLNVTSATAYDCQFMRVGNVVTVSGMIEITPTANNLQTMVGFDLPIATTVFTSYFVAGTCHADSSIKVHGVVHGDTANNRAEMDFDSSAATVVNMFFTMTYLIR